MSVVTDAGLELRLDVRFDQEVSDLLRAEGFGCLIRLPSDEGAYGRNLLAVPDDAPEIPASRFQSPMVLGLIVGTDARDLDAAVIAGLTANLKGVRPSPCSILKVL